PFPSEEEVERLLALPPSPLISLSPPSAEERLARYLAAPALPSSPLPIVPHPYGSPNHVRAPPGFRASMGRLRASSPSTHHLLHPSPPLPPLPLSLYLPPPVPTSSPLPSPPLPPQPALLFIPSVVDRREDIPEVELPPRKRLCLATPTSRYEMGESSTAARPTGVHRADYGFIGTLDAETRQTVEEVAPTTLEGVNASVTKLTAVQEQDTLDIYAEALASQEAWVHLLGLSLAVHYELQAYRTHTQIQDHRIASQEALTSTLAAHVLFLQGQLSAALGQIQELQARDPTHADDPEGADSSSMAVGFVLLFLVSDNHNNMPPRRTSATARAVATAARAVAVAAPMTAAVVEQLIEERVSVALANHETLRNSINGHGGGSHNSHTRTRGTNQIKFATCTFLGNALTWWNSYMKTVTQDVAYAMDWKALKKMMSVKYCPMGEIKKLEIELWNLKVKGTDVASYTLRFQELALMCGRMFHEESNEVEKYVGGLPDMIRGNVMSYQPKMMEKAIKFANDQMDQKVLTIAEIQAEQKRKLEFNAGNNQGHQQQNKRQNTGKAYTGPCAPRCNKCKKIGHLARDCRSSGPNGINNNRGNSGTTQNAGTCYECDVQGHFKSDCSNLKNRNHGNQGGNGNAPAKVYVGSMQEQTRTPTSLR
ncbi:reverse transcriptase domain-containing protein, partial [Tanacetum coccineum]